MRTVTDCAQMQKCSRVTNFMQSNGAKLKSQDSHTPQAGQGNYFVKCFYFYKRMLNNIDCHRFNQNIYFCCFQFYLICERQRHNIESKNNGVVHTVVQFGLFFLSRPSVKNVFILYKDINCHYKIANSNCLSPFQSLLKIMKRDVLYRIFFNVNFDFLKWHIFCSAHAFRSINDINTSKTDKYTRDNLWALKKYNRMLPNEVCIWINTVERMFTVFYKWICWK